MRSVEDDKGGEVCDRALDGLALWFCDVCADSLQAVGVWLADRTRVNCAVNACTLRSQRVSVWKFLSSNFITSGPSCYLSTRLSSLVLIDSEKQ